MVRETNGSSEKLLLKPETEDPLEFKRQITQYEDLSSCFTLDSVDFSKQFCHIYAIRLAELREILIPRVTAKWGKFCLHKMCVSFIKIIICYNIK